MHAGGRRSQTKYSFGAPRNFFVKLIRYLGIPKTIEHIILNSSTTDSICISGRWGWHAAHTKNIVDHCVFVAQLVRCTYSSCFPCKPSHHHFGK